MNKEILRDERTLLDNPFFDFFPPSMEHRSFVESNQTIPQRPSFVTGESLKATQTLTTPYSNGNILTAPKGCQWEGNTPLVMKPPKNKGLKVDDKTQLWTYRDRPGKGNGNVYLADNSGGTCAFAQNKNLNYYIGSSANNVDYFYGKDPIVKDFDGTWSHIKDSVEMVHANDKDVFPGKNPLPWISLNDAYSCCLLEPILAKQQYGKYCDPSYMPSGKGSVCPWMMAEYCQEFWAKDENTQNVCANNYFNQSHFQANQQDVKKALHELFVNFLLLQDPVQGQGYNKKRDGESTGANYKFYTQVLPSLASIHIPGATGSGPLDNVLDYYCRGFTREDMKKDEVLQLICGCHLLGTGGNPDKVHVPENNAGQKLNIPVTKNVGDQYPYVTVSCDPVCNLSRVIPNYTQPVCKQTECIIDNININQIGSKGDIIVGMACGNCENANDCNCYISNVEVNSINSSGRIKVEQNCGNCFIFTGGNIKNSVNVPCSSLKPSPPKPGPSSVGKYMTYISSGLLILTIIAAIITFFIQ